MNPRLYQRLMPFLGEGRRKVATFNDFDERTEYDILEYAKQKAESWM